MVAVAMALCGDNLLQVLGCCRGFGLKGDGRVIASSQYGDCLFATLALYLVGFRYGLQECGRCVPLLLTGKSGKMSRCCAVLILYLCNLFELMSGVGPS